MPPVRRLEFFLRRLVSRRSRDSPSNRLCRAERKAALVAVIDDPHLSDAVFVGLYRVRQMTFAVATVRALRIRINLAGGFPRLFDERSQISVLLLESADLFRLLPVGRVQQHHRRLERIVDSRRALQHALK